ncbi:MAG: EAL domain-containing protein, partial [Phycisphaerae bacterium]|nr:EAL domain-containing protein [Phycisphaerae bacterium]MDW8260889.1 EAL domain-containing protein [Phycisphaerales bacterium]
RRAIEREQLRLYFQPIVSLESGQVTGFEALVRWLHPEKGLIPPQDFIEMVEETGFIVQLGDRVIEDACKTLAGWRARYPHAAADLTVSVNVSRKQLMVDGLARHLAECFKATGVPPDRLILEITESCVMHEAETVIKRLEEVRACGAQVFIDDFGTGYSSLSCLHQLPLNGMKIDRAFVRDASGRRQYLAIIHAIVTLARNLNMSMIAEGVESLEQVALLQSLDCDKAQGYLFSHPVDVASAEALIVQKARKAA